MRCLGLLSGTSMDSIDCALVRFEDTGDLLLERYRQFPFPDGLHTRLRALNAGSRLEEVSGLHIELAEAFASAATQLLAETKLPASQVEAIGCHGQTVLHMPDAAVPRTVQIGDGSTLAWRTRIPVVCDFRSMDIAAGGQGAPLAAIFHAHRFRHPDIARAILNIGGIANITLLPADAREPPRGFDTGPGNALLDDWNLLHQGTAFDKDGHWAAGGRCEERLLRSLLSDRWFHQVPPKSSGRDYFHLDWLRQHMQQTAPKAVAQDVQATLLELSAQTMRQAVQENAVKATELYLCGGGTHNVRLYQRLQELLPGVRIQSTAALGLDPDAVEAVCFAWLAHRRILNLPLQQRSITGAQGHYLPGGLYTVPESVKEYC